jgi:hypothetical protein
MQAEPSTLILILSKAESEKQIHSPSIIISEFFRNVWLDERPVFRLSSPSFFEPSPRDSGRSLVVEQGRPTGE